MFVYIMSDSTSRVINSLSEHARHAARVDNYDDNHPNSTLVEVFSSLVGALTRLSEHLPSISGKFILFYIHEIIFIRNLFVIYSHKFLFTLFTYCTFTPLSYIPYRLFPIPILFQFSIVLARRLIIGLYSSLNHNLFDRILFCVISTYALLVYFLITSSSGIYITSISFPQLLFLLFHFNITSFSLKIPTVLFSLSSHYLLIIYLL